MTHEHDFDLIASIAEGGLNPAEQRAAEARLESCQDCRTDLQLQREALALLRSAPTVSMTDLERASVHRGVEQRVGPAVRTERLRPGAPWFQRLMPVMSAAAALLIVVGVGSVLVDGSNNADLATETTAVATGDGAETSNAEELAEISGPLLDAAADLPTTTVVFAAPGVSNVQEYGPISRTDLVEIASQLKTSGPTEIEQGYSPETLRSLDLEPALVCADLAIADGNVTAIGRANVDGDPVEIYRIDDVIAVYSTADCSVTDLFE
jgi:hypothetical protein